MKARIKMIAMRLAAVGLALAPLTAPARARQVVPNGLANSNGLNSVNGLHSVNGMASINGLTLANASQTKNGLSQANGPSQPNGLCPSSIPCSFDSVTTFIAI